jgi:peptidyl-prolyl cis-trans isomerase SurA
LLRDWLKESLALKKNALLLSVALLLLIAVRGLAGQQQGELLDRVLVRVNGEILTQKQLTQKQIEALQRNPNTTDARALQDDAILRAKIAEVTPRLLVEAVDELLLVQRGRELKVRFTDELFKQAVENLKKQNKFESDEELVKALTQEGMSLDQLRVDFERAYTVQAVQQREIGQRMNLTEEERRQFYNSHREMFLSPATVTLREIFVAFGPEPKGGQSTASAAEEAAAKAKIDAARERAVAGADFAALVTEVSEAPTKANGGLVGPVKIEDINPALADLVTKLASGEVSAPVRDLRGYRIFKLESRSAAEPRPYDEVRDQIQQRIFEDRLEGEVHKLLERLRAQAVIEWKDESYRQLYAKALGEAVPQ